MSSSVASFGKRSVMPALWELKNVPTFSFSMSRPASQGFFDTTLKSCVRSAMRSASCDTAPR